MQKNQRPQPRMRRQQKSEKPKSNVPMLLMVAAGVGAFFYFTREKPEVIQAPAKAPEVRKTDSHKAAAVEILRDEGQLTPPTTTQEERRTQFLARLSLNAKSMDLAEADGRLKIPFEFFAKKQWCIAGDLDTIRYVLTDTSKSELLISLEPFTGSGRASSKRISLDGLLRGVQHQFQVPVSDEAAAYGLFICRDSKNEGSCRRKVLATHKEISDQVADLKTEAATKAKDHIFYFQPILIKDGKLEGFDTGSFSDKKGQQLQTYLVGQSKISGADFNTMWRIAQVAKSTGLDVADGKLKLALPYNDPRCMKQGALGMAAGGSGEAPPEQPTPEAGAAPAAPAPAGSAAP